MTDTMKAPAWHTTAASPAVKLAEARAEITRLTDSLRWVEHCRSQVEDSVQGEKDATLRAEQRADAEADRADGAESHLRRVLAAYIVEPALGTLDGPSDGVDLADVPSAVLDAVADSLKDDLDGGLGIDDLPDAARGHLNDWAEGLK